ncbi:MAG: hypothetical protein IPM43_13055 [Actinomycetota bacterium]|nr:MAG: hypothetical protein IPM43_13055 [Actinomycetota bacterium]
MARRHVFGIRHHGPGSARSVQRALDSTRPDVVLIELPADAASALALVARDDLVPPVALLAHVVDHPEQAAFWPLASFSPEWVAARWAHANGVAVRAIDLPAAATLALDAAPRDEPTLAGIEESTPPPADPLRVLADAAGEDDPERWWDDVVEHRGDGEPAFDAVGEAMAAVRAGWVPGGVDARREAHMRRSVHQAGRDGFQNIAVVCGAWHVPALVEPWPSAGHDAALLRGCPKVKVSLTWVPWTLRRLAAGTGYSAGVASPKWYAHVFEHPGADGVVHWFADAAHALRAEGYDASPDHLVAAARLSNSLAALRSRPRAGLAEVLDAAGAVLGDGKPGPLQLLHDRLVVGRSIGSVPADVPMVPLARDLATWQRRCRLTPRAEVHVVELDLRTPNGSARSRLLHRLDALELGWGALTSGRGSSGTFREAWRLAWEPELAVVLVERAGLGTTVVAAASARLAERARGTSSLAALVGLISTALAADLRGAVVELVDELALRAAHDPAVVDLLDALTPLAEASRYGDVRGTEATALGKVVDGLVGRALAGLETACVALAADEAGAMAERLAAAQSALALVDHPARHRAWPEVLARLAARSGVAAAVQGRAARLLHDSGHWSSELLGARLGRALSPGVPPAEGAAFVEGMLSGSGAVLVHDAELLALIDRWLSELGPDPFFDAMPLLRRTFGAFASAERRQLGELVARRARRPHPSSFGELDAERAAAAMATVRAMLGVAR